MRTSNVSSIVDLLEDRGISWGAYLETMPYTGYTGEVGDTYYYRKHNPLVFAPSIHIFVAYVAQISYQSVASNDSRVAHIKNLTLFYSDLAIGNLPQVMQQLHNKLTCQWMYISPNILNDGNLFLGNYLTT